MSQQAKPGRIILSPGNKLLPDSRFFTNRFEVITLVAEPIRIEQHKRTREWRCNCREFTKSNTLTTTDKICMHLRKYAIPGGGQPYEAKLIVLKGRFQRRVARQREKARAERGVT